MLACVIEIKKKYQKLLTRRNHNKGNNKNYKKKKKKNSISLDARLLAHVVCETLFLKKLKKLKKKKIATNFIKKKEIDRGMDMAFKLILILFVILAII